MAQIQVQKSYAIYILGLRPYSIHCLLSRRNENYINKFDIGKHNTMYVFEHKYSITTRYSTNLKNDLQLQVKCR